MKKKLFKFLALITIIDILGALALALVTATYFWVILAIICAFSYVVFLIILILNFVWYWVDDGFKETWDLFTNPNYDD